MSASPIQRLSCPNCRAPISRLRVNSGARHPCSGCGKLLRTDAYPALARDMEAGEFGERVTSDEQATCFYHPGKKAVVHCDSCGRFLCALCDLPMGNRHLCPNCLEEGQEKENSPQALVQTRMLWDRLAILLVAIPIIPLFFLWPAIVTAPAALLIVIFKWRAPGSLLGVSRTRFVIAGILAILELVGVGLFIYGLVSDVNDFMM